MCTGELGDPERMELGTGRGGQGEGTGRGDQEPGTGRTSLRTEFEGCSSRCAHLPSSAAINFTPTES